MTGKELATLATLAAERAGDILRDRWGSDLQVDELRANDVKLEADRLCEAAILEVIQQTCPGDAILSEECGPRPGAERVWIIDPLDGTVNYYQGLPYFCTSIACHARPDPRLFAPGDDAMRHGPALLGEPLVGVVHMPLLRETFVAIRGGGATRNGEPIRACRATSLADCVVATGFGSTAAGKERMLGGNQRLASRVRKIRCLGAAAYDLANVACGRLSGFYELGLHPWDIAAGRLLVEEAGGTVDAFTCAPGRWDVVAAGAGVVAELAAVVRSS